MATNDCVVLTPKVQENVPTVEVTATKESAFVGKNDHVVVERGKNVKKRKNVDDMSDGSCYDRFCKSGGLIVGLFRLRDAIGLEVFKIAEFMFNRNLPGRYKT